MLEVTVLEEIHFISSHARVDFAPSDFASPLI